MKEKRFMVTDTETTGLGNRSFVFDFAYVISNRRGKIFQERNFLIKEILTDPKVMLGALYNQDWRAMMGGKIFRYYIPALNSGELKLTPWRDVIQTMREDVKTYGVNAFSAYNLPFDLGAMQKTHNRIVEKNLDFSKLDLLCLWEFASITVLRSRNYHDTCARLNNPTAHDWISEVGNVRTTAEKTYAFITGDFDFIESHTALHDAQIETDILHRLLARKTPIPYNIVKGFSWRKAQRRQDGQLAFAD